VIRTNVLAGLATVLGAAIWIAPAGIAQQPQPVAPLAPPGQGRTADLELLQQFDQDKNGWLSQPERTAARARLAELRAGRGGGGARGGGAAAPIVAGRRIQPADVEQYPGVGLYDTTRLRTIFLEFEHDNWEDELEAFYHTDVELPATLRADGRTYANVGIQFRGNSSFFSVARGRKRSLSISMDHVNATQRLEGYRALTLLNAHSDPTFLRSMLYLDLARQYLPALKANYVRVVINGESWGVYVNQQRFNKEFIKDAFGTEEGVRFKSSNRSRGGGLSYLGESIDDYRRWYEIQSADRDESWKPLMNVTRVLAETPPDRLRAAIEPIFNVDGALRYLALDIVMMSGDGYWLHGSDYNLYADPKGVLHILHHDANEAFTAQGAGGRGGGPRDAGADPFVSTDDPFKALRHKLLVVPEYRAKYLQYVRDIARNALNWATVGPKIDRFRALIRADVEADTRKLYTTEEFTTAVFGGGEARPPATTLKGFILDRREFLLAHPAIQAMGR